MHEILLVFDSKTPLKKKRCCCPSSSPVDSEMCIVQLPLLLGFAALFVIAVPQVLWINRWF